MKQREREMYMTLEMILALYRKEKGRTEQVQLLLRFMKHRMD